MKTVSGLPPHSEWPGDRGPLCTGGDLLNPPSSPIHYLTYVKVYEASGDNLGGRLYTGLSGFQCRSPPPAWWFTAPLPIHAVGCSVWYGPPNLWVRVAIRYTPWTAVTFGFGFGWSWGSSTVAWVGAGVRIRGGGNYGWVTPGPALVSGHRWRGVAQLTDIAACAVAWDREDGRPRAISIINGVTGDGPAALCRLQRLTGNRWAGQLALRITRAQALRAAGNACRAQCLYR